MFDGKSLKHEKADLDLDLRLYFPPNVLAMYWDAIFVPDNSQNKSPFECFLPSQICSLFLRTEILTVGIDSKAATYSKDDLIHIDTTTTRNTH